MPLIDLLKALLGKKPPAAVPGQSAETKTLPDSPDEPAQISSPKVLLIVFNPVLESVGGATLSEHMAWSKPDDLVSRFVGDILQASNGLVRYRIEKRVELNEFPVLTDGFRYDSTAYLGLMDRQAVPHTPTGVDYAAMLERFDAKTLVADGIIDEVWVMGFPHAGLYESAMAGAGAFWCNAPPLANTSSWKRRFVVMGFSYERNVGEMLHSFNHRAEAVLAHIFGCQDFLAWTYKPNRIPATVQADQELNPFERYILYDKIAPGRAGVGNVHYAPNSAQDYDLGNRRPVISECYDWLHFPDFRGDRRMVSAFEWGGGSERGYQRWWLEHLPKVAGRKGGIHNNWWQYIANLDNVPT
jgi:hypothetical protein